MNETIREEIERLRAAGFTVTAPPPRRPWWRRKRWWAALLLWLVVAYPLGFGLLGYGIGRGRISWPVAELYARPAAVFLGPPDRTAVGRALRDFTEWGAALGEAHAASD